MASGSDQISRIFPDRRWWECAAASSPVCCHSPKRLRWTSRNVCRGRQASTVAVPSASLCDALEFDVTRADSEPGLPPPMCPASTWPTKMECEATPIQQIEVQAISLSGGGWDSQRRCWRLRIVVGPKPRRQELHDDTDGGTDVRATVRGDASGALFRQSLECHRRKQVCHQRNQQSHQLTQECRRSCDGTSSGRGRNRGHVFGQRVMPITIGRSEMAHLTLKLGTLRRRPLAMPARIRNIAAGMTSLDAVNIKTCSNAQHL